MNGSGRGVYVGRSSEAELVPGDPEEPTLAKALRAAYDQGMADKPPGQPGKFKVLDIWIEGTNPITDYVVEVAG